VSNSFNPDYQMVVPYGEIMVLVSKLPNSEQVDELRETLEDLAFSIPKERKYDE
jgi:hypothetical protein